MLKSLRTRIKFRAYMCVVDNVLISGHGLCIVSRYEHAHYSAKRLVLEADPRHARIDCEALARPGV